MNDRQKVAASSKTRRDQFAADDAAMMHARAICQQTIVKWKPLMGLGHWRIDSAWFRDEADIPKEMRADDNGYRGALMWVQTEWEYLQATVNVNLPACIGLEDEKLAHCIRHELAHVVVNEMREWATHPTDPSDQAMKHEERVVETLSLAFEWTETAGWNDGKADLRRKQKAEAAGKKA